MKKQQFLVSISMKVSRTEFWGLSKIFYEGLATSTLVLEIPPWQKPE